MKKLIAWLDQYLLAVWAGLLMFFIPLYPKLPLADILPGYIVRVRLEDILIAIGVALTIREAVKRRREVKIKKIPLFWPIVAYLAVGFLSSLSAMFITQTVPLQAIHVGKLWLHFFRRVEYFSLFFVFYYAVLTLPKKWRTWAMWPLVLVLVLVAIYGFGQKYLYWPVFLTMNREFSKGMRLYLTEHARVPSTFGGHYDLAIFLVILLPLCLAFFYSTKKLILKIAVGIAFAFGFWLLILTASRTSFIAYLFAIVVLFAVLIFKKGWRWSIWRGSLVVFLSLFVMLFFGDLSSRYAHLVKGVKEYPSVCLDEQKSQEPFRLIEEAPLPGRKSAWEKKKLQPARENTFCQLILGVNKVVDLKKLANTVNNSRLVAWFKDYKNRKPKTKTDSSVVTQTDELPTPEKPLPPDVYEDIPDKKIVYDASDSAEASPTPKVVYVPRTYSDNAYKYGLSIAIRLDALWPRAWEGFKRNPFLGSGYSTLTKVKLTDFTEAESTDNDYLRMLGETGALGTMTFLGIIGFLGWKVAQVYFKSTQTSDQLVSAAILAALAGLLLNAMYIDVFEASKVAYTIWGLSGIYLAVYYQKLPKKVRKKSKLSTWIKKRTSKFKNR